MDYLSFRHSHIIGLANRKYKYVRVGAYVRPFTHVQAHTHIHTVRRTYV